MNGSLITAWPFTWDSIWADLYQHEDAKEDLFIELFREISVVLKSKITVEELADIIDSPEQSTTAFKKLSTDSFESESHLVDFMESVFSVLDDYSGERIVQFYFSLLENFLRSYNLRYELTPSRRLCPTLPGIFTSLFFQLRTISAGDTHVKSLLQEFEDSLKDLKMGQTEGRIKTCIQKQINVLEAICKNHPQSKENTLGAMCDDLGTWPHVTVRNALKSLYGFSSEYPGIRHSGNPKGALRSIDMTDLVSVLIILTGFTPYLSDRLDSNDLYIAR